MIVYKFGGAAVKDADTIRNLATIISGENSDLLMVISAMGKMTNAFELLINKYFAKKDYRKELEFVVTYHKNIIQELEIDKIEFNKYLSLLKNELVKGVTSNYNYEYDRIIGYGELFSTIIVSQYLKQHVGLDVEWIDVRNLIKTDRNYRFANVDWQKTIENTKQNIDFEKHKIYLTQGFIASDKENKMTSLGREGSDYSAAILSYALSAQSITIWKDVKGVLDVDPRIFEKTNLLEQLSFYDAIELAFFGAQVIHPKTIQPLKNRKIPLFVRSFIELQSKGTLVSNQKIKVEYPVVIIKENQVLLSITTRDFSFVNEKNISSIFSILSDCNAKVNMMQNGAVSFSLVVDYMPRSFKNMIDKLSIDFDLRYNVDLKLITIRYYTEEKVRELIGEQKVFLEQKSRNTAQYLVKSIVSNEEE